MATTSISNFDAASQHANNIGGIAEEMKKTLDSTGQEMDDMYGNNWQSSGAQVTRDSFEEKRLDFDIFYKNVLAMQENVAAVVEEGMKTDEETKAEVSSVYNQNSSPSSVHGPKNIFNQLK